MFDLITAMIGLTAAVTASAFGYIRARTFVTRRLRYVDAVRSPAAPFVAGAAATAIAAPVVWVLPIIGAGTAIAFGVATAIGTHAGVREITTSY